MTEKEQVDVIQKNNSTPQLINKSLTAFILSIVGLAFSLTGILSVPGLVMGIVGLAFSNGCEAIEKKPYKAFKNIAHKLSVVAIVAGAFLATALTIALIILAIYIAYKNGTQATSQIGIF